MPNLLVMEVRYQSYAMYFQWCVFNIINTPPTESQLLTGSFDCTARIHGLKSGKTLKELRGHTSYVNSVCYAAEGTRVVTGSSDGVLRVRKRAKLTCFHFC